MAICSPISAGPLRQPRETIRVTRPQTKGPPERPMVPNASKAFRWQLPCLTLRRQLTARRLAGCCRVDARFTLAFRTLASGRWPLDTGPVGHRLPSALVAFGARRLRLGTVRETRSINRR